MGLFSKKFKPKEIHDGVWGHLVSVHGVDVDTISKEMRCVEREGPLDGKVVTFMRVFKPGEAEKKGVAVTGWGTFDEHPELILFEGYIRSDNKAFLERKKTEVPL